MVRDLVFDFEISCEFLDNEGVLQKQIKNRNVLKNRFELPIGH